VDADRTRRRQRRRAPLEIRGRIIGIAVLAAILGTLAAAPGASADAGSSLELSGVPATLQSPGIFTMAVKGTTAEGANGIVKIFTGPEACDPTAIEELTNQPLDVVLSGPRGQEVPLIGGFKGAFSVFAEIGYRAELTYTEVAGHLPSAPVPYNVCAYLESTASANAAKTSATFSLIPAAPSAHPGGPPGTGPVPAPAAKKCIVPRIKGMKLAAAEKALTHGGCSVGRVKKVSSRHVRRGRVISQSLSAGRSLAAGTKVNIVISKG
jgi:hypothetical protein